MTIRDDLYFVYNGISSKEMDILSVNIDGAMLEENFTASRTINEVSIKGSNRPLFSSITYTPITFNLNLVFRRGFSERRVEEIARWLVQPFYREIYFSNNPQKRMYVMSQGDSLIIHNAIKQGYLTLEFKNVDCYRYSPVLITPVCEYANNSTTGTQATLENNGSIPIYPTLLIEKVGAGDITIVNLSNQGQSFELTSLVDEEYLIVDMEEQNIETDLSATSRYKDHNGIWLELLTGDNYLQVYGNCRLKWKYQYKYLS